MKIALILIVHLGLVAVQANPNALKCQAIEELDAYFFDPTPDPKGTRLSAMLDRFTIQGLMTTVKRDDFKKKIAAAGEKLQPVALEVEKFLRSQTCNCTGNVGLNDTVGIVGSNDTLEITGLKITAEVIRLNAKAKIDKVNAKSGTIGLNVEAGSIKLKATAEKACVIFTCLTCNAIDEVIKYIVSKGVDTGGVVLLDLVKTFNGKDLITTQQLDNIKTIINTREVPMVNRRKYHNRYIDEAYQVINYLKTNSQSNCCGNAAGYKCEVGISKEEAVDQLKEFINKNDQDILKLWTKLNNFFIEGLLSKRQWRRCVQLKDGDLKGKPKELAEEILKDIFRKNAIVELDCYMQNNPTGNDPNAVRLFGMLRKYEKEGVMTKQVYEICEDVFPSCEVDSNSYLMANLVRDNLKSGKEACGYDS